MGDCKPEFDVFLQPIVDELRNFEQGKFISIGNQMQIFKGYFLFGIYDKPARASVNNTTLASGQYGCIKCVQKGKRLKNNQSK